VCGNKSAFIKKNYNFDKFKNMNKNLNVIPDNADVVFIALNPTALAIENDALFSRDESLWNILIKAGILKESIKEVDLKNRVKEVCGENKHTVNNLKIGIADLLPLTIESDSKKVKVNHGDANKLFEFDPQLKTAKKIVLLGQKVVDGFRKDFPHLKSWADLRKSTAGGYIGSIFMGSHEIKVYSMPFPSTNNIPDKHTIYAKI
jgi:hypothetical protein